MLEQISSTETVHGDEVHLYLNPARYEDPYIERVFDKPGDGYHDRYVFLVAGRRFGGYGTVGMSAVFLTPRGITSAHDPDAKVAYSTWAESGTHHTDHPGIDLNSIPYKGGCQWRHDGRLGSIDLKRADGKTGFTETDRIETAFRAARDLLMGVPDLQRLTTARAIKQAYQEDENVRRAAARRQTALAARLRFLTGEDPE